MSLVVRYIEDDKPGLDDKAVLMTHLQAMKSNGGDTRCLCTGCLAFWVLRHFGEEKTNETPGSSSA